MINIIKSGVGNIGSLIKVINDLEYDYRIISDPSEFTNTKKIILPGVGSFDSFINSLKDQNLFDSIYSLVNNQSYSILGICVGMQSLFKKSEEGILNGLDLIDGECIKFKIKNQKVPHLGWNNVNIKQNNEITNDIKKNSFYFAHSYHVANLDNECIVATTDHENIFPSIINVGNIYGVQFHPEKSYDQGKKLIKNFIEKC